MALDSCFSGAGGRSVIAKGSRPLVMNLRAISREAQGDVIDLLVKVGRALEGS